MPVEVRAPLARVLEDASARDLGRQARPRRNRERYGLSQFMSTFEQ
jgi:hypothetical protein